MIYCEKMEVVFRNMLSCNDWSAVDFFSSEPSWNGLNNPTSEQLVYVFTVLISEKY